jgi:hypothetical protein
MTYRPLFPLGILTQTPGVQAAVDAGYIFECVARHQSGDWGVISRADVPVNKAALRDGDRILSAYYLDPERPDRGKFWVITEADRSTTTALLPDEY